MVRTAAEQLGRIADRAQELGPKGVADEVAHFARRRPLVFLAGAAATGFVVGRIARNAGESHEPATAHRRPRPAREPRRRAACGDRSAARRSDGARRWWTRRRPLGVPVSSVDRQTEPLQPERSLSDLFSTMSEDLSTLVRKELELAREEVKVEASRSGNVAKFFGAAGVTGYFAVMMLLFAAAWGLAAVMPDGLAFLIVGVVLGAIAAVLAVRGRAQAQH